MHCSWLNQDQSGSLRVHLVVVDITGDPEQQTQPHPPATQSNRRNHTHPQPRATDATTPTRSPERLSLPLPPAAECDCRRQCRRRWWLGGSGLLAGCPGAVGVVFDGEVVGVELVVVFVAEQGEVGQVGRAAVHPMPDVV